MLSLILKDIRQTVWPIAFAWLMVIAPPSIVLFSLIAERKQPSWHETQSLVASTFVFGAVASFLAASSIAGVAFARERRERTGDWLSTLPIPRLHIVSSKALVALSMTLIPIIVALAAAWVLAPDKGRPDFADHAAWRLAVLAVTAVASAWLMLFGLGWFFSSLLKSDVLASALPVLAIILIPMAFAAWVQVRGGLPSTRSDEWIAVRFIWLLAPLGALGLLAGTVIALARRSP